MHIFFIRTFHQCMRRFQSLQRTNDNDMVIQLPFLFSLLTIHLRHLFKTVEHCLHDPIISSVNVAPHFQTVGANKLRLNSTHKSWEVLDEMHNTTALLSRQPRLFYVPDLFVLKEKFMADIRR